MDNRTNNEEANFIPMPEIYSRRKLNSLYREIPLKDTAFSTMRKYFNAMANLYGIVTLKKAYEIISEQNASLVTKDEFLAFAGIARHERENYCILGSEEIYINEPGGTAWEREIIHNLLLEDDLEPYFQTKKIQQGKPYYIPEKSQLLEYNDPFYCENTPEVLAMRSFLAKKFGADTAKCEEVFDETLYSSRYLDVEFFQMLNQLYDMGLNFKDEADFQKFVELYQNFYNATKIPYNRGYSPNEISRMQASSEHKVDSISLGPNILEAISDGKMDIKKLREDILSMEMPNEQLRLNLLKEVSNAESAAKNKRKKIGRNEACPCGSGKKYKHCCGR